MLSIADTLAQAQAHHKVGDLRNAEQLYRRVLQSDPAHAQALYLLAEVCQALRRPAEAEAMLRQAVRAKPGFPEAHNNLGVAMVVQGRPAEAAAFFRRAIELKPDYVEANYNLAAAAVAQNALDEAAARCRRAVELKPDLVDGHLMLANIAVRRKQLGEAEACYRRAIELKPNLAAAHASLGGLLAKQEKLDEAAAHYRRALQLKPDAAAVHNDLGALLAKQRRFDEAIVCCRRALELKPDFAEGHNNLGVIYQGQELWEEAAASYRRALELKPELAEAHNNLGVVLVQQDKVDEVLACCARALELAPDFAEAHLNNACALLSVGRFAEGWSEYEWRWKQQDVQEPRFAQPRLTLGALEGRTVLLHCEQGYGDTLQFIRYAELLQQRGARVIVRCPPGLKRLLARLPGVEVVPEGPLPEFDVHAPLLSVPGILETALASIPARIPYLAPDEESVEIWKRELKRDAGIHVGIAWCGNPEHRSDRWRSIPLAHFAGLARIPGVHVYSLQVGAGREQLTQAAGQMAITDLGGRLEDFHDTAAVMRNLDLVIGCDSAPVHLAGALGVPVWVAVTHAADWRWMRERTDSPWYPTMRVFRQSVPGDWGAVFARIEEEFSRWPPAPVK